MLTGTLLFVSLSHHLLNFWELPGLWMLAGLFTLLPLSMSGMAIIFRQFGPFVSRIPKPTLTLYLIAALLLGGFVTWRTYRLPQSYQTLTITPMTGQVALVEIKNNGNPLPLEKSALESGWQVQEDLVHAAQESKPLRLTFQTPTGQPITLLFLTSSEGGTAQVTLNGQMSWLSLDSERMGQTTLRLTAEYRGLPGEAFRFLLLFSSLFSFGTIGLLLLSIQHIGQENLPPKNAPVGIHQRNLLILSLLSLSIYSLNALTVPLGINPDSPSLLAGAVHLLQHGNLEGVWMYRGPGSTLLFAPVMLLFGNNAWGVKLLLHFLAFSCLFPAYRLGWQLSKSQNVAFIAGLLAVLSPDLMAYASVVMSELPNIFLVLSFLTLLVSALQKLQPKWIFSTLLTGSFAVLLRYENMVMFGIGVFALSIYAISELPKTKKPGSIFVIALATLLSILPIFGWQLYTKTLHGVTGINNNSSILYDGWVYYGDALGQKFSNPNSPAGQTIQAVIQKYPIEISDRKGVPTGSQIYPALLEAGYSPKEALDLLEAATWDAIRGNPAKAIEILFRKYKDGLTPYAQPLETYPLPGEPTFGEILTNEYFYETSLNLPGLISLRRRVHQFSTNNYLLLHPNWVLFTIFAVFLSFFRSTWNVWSTVTVITLSRLFIAITLGIAFWRYALPGWIPAQILAILWLWTMGHGLRQIISAKNKHAVL